MMTEQEFAYLSDRIRGRLTALARRFNRASGCDADAEDIVQDALLTLWQLSKKGYPIRDEEALAVKITKTRCIESMTVVKNGVQEEVKKYAGWENGVILVVTKKDGD